MFLLSASLFGDALSGFEILYTKIHEFLTQFFKSTKKVLWKHLLDGKILTEYYFVHLRHYELGGFK